MSVLKIKKNGVWENVSGISGHTHTISDITDFPEDFTASGGDADTVDGKHASDFATADHTHEQIDVLTSLVGDTDVSTQIANAIVSKAESVHVHNEATTDTSGFMGAADKEKLDGIESGANKTIVDDSFVAGSTNPVQSQAIWSEVEFIWEEMNNKATLLHSHSLSQVSETNDRKIMTAAERTKLEGIDEGANKTVVDSALSETSTNPVENKAVYKAINDLSTLVGDTDISVQIENAISGKADEDHSHEAGDITGLATVAASGSYKDLSDRPTPVKEITVGDGLSTTVTQIMSDNTFEVNIDINLDSTLSSTSTNPVQNKVIYNAIESAKSAAESYTDSAFSNVFDGHTHETSDINDLAEYIRQDGNTANTATGPNGSHAGGNQTEATGDASFAHGYKCKAPEVLAVALGECTEAGMRQLVCGQHNTVKAGGGVGSQSNSDTVFLIGNGTSSSSKSVAFRVAYDGACYSATGTINSGADYAEYFEWIDGNPNSEDRRGKFVTLDGEKIRLANADDAYILGVISSTPGCIGNAASEDWKSRYMTDIFGAKIYQNVDVPETVNEETGMVTPAHTVKRWVVNPDYDPNQEYISRENRPEWAPVGMLGQIVVVDDGTCVVNGYCAPSVDGIGTAAESGYRVMKRIDDTHIKVLVR